MTGAALRLAEALIARPSVTPDDAGCQTLIVERLAPLGFSCERIASGPEHFRVSIRGQSGHFTYLPGESEFPWVT